MFMDLDYLSVNDMQNKNLVNIQAPSPRAWSITHAYHCAILFLIAIFYRPTTNPLHKHKPALGIGYGAVGRTASGEQSDVF